MLVAFYVCKTLDKIFTRLNPASVIKNSAFNKTRHCGSP
jgi:hypothetical protein